MNSSYLTSFVLRIAALMQKLMYYYSSLIFKILIVIGWSETSNLHVAPDRKHKLTHYGTKFGYSEGMTTANDGFEGFCTCSVSATPTCSGRNWGLSSPWIVGSEL